MNGLGVALVGARIAEIELEAIRVEERVRQHGVHLGHRHELESLPNFLGNLIEVGDIALGKNDALDPCAMRSKHLLFDSADREHAAAQRDLAEPLSVEPMGIAVSAKDARFYNLIDNYIEAIEATGILSALRQKWFEDPSWLEELP